MLCLGELLVDFVPDSPGPIRHAGLFRKAAGGAPANVAVGLARLGVGAGFMGQVGDDGFGRFLADTLGDAGVDTAALRFTGAAPTALAFVSLGEAGERSFLFYRNPSADMLYAPADVDEDAIAGARALHFGSISLVSDPSRAATLHAVAVARRHGVRVSYDPNLRLPLWPSEAAARDGLLLGWRHASVVKVAADEVEFLTGNADPVAGVRSLWHDGLELVAVTLGAGGCVWVTAGAHNAVPGFVVLPVDTTGAGDAFMAGLLAGLHAEPGATADPAALDRICTAANAMGALTTTAPGAIPSIPGRAALHAFIASKGMPA